MTQEQIDNLWDIWWSIMEDGPDFYNAWYTHLPSKDLILYELPNILHELEEEHEFELPCPGRYKVTKKLDGIYALQVAR